MTVKAHADEDAFKPRCWDRVCRFPVAAPGKIFAVAMAGSRKMGGARFGVWTWLGGVSWRKATTVLWAGSKLTRRLIEGLHTDFKLVSTL